MFSQDVRNSIKRGDMRCREVEKIGLASIDRPIRTYEVQSFPCWFIECFDERIDPKVWILPMPVMGSSLWSDWVLSTIHPRKREVFLVDGIHLDEHIIMHQHIAIIMGVFFTGQCE